MDEFSVILDLNEIEEEIKEKLLPLLKMLKENGSVSVTLDGVGIPF